MDDLESGTGVSDLEGTVEDLQTAVDDTLCPWVSEASDYVYSC